MNNLSSSLHCFNLTEQARKIKYKRIIIARWPSVIFINNSFKNEKFSFANDEKTFSKRGKIWKKYFSFLL